MPKPFLTYEQQLAKLRDEKHLVISDQESASNKLKRIGYCGGTIKTYTDENRNLYISVLRTVIKKELSDGETEIMNYGFNHEKKDYIAVYYGTPNNCELIWKKGDLLPTAPKDIFE